MTIKHLFPSIRAELFNRNIDKVISSHPMERKCLSDFEKTFDRTYFAVFHHRNFMLPSCVADIQEFYELTLLDDTKSIQQKTAETIRIANKWEASDGPITPTYGNNDVSHVTLYSLKLSALSSKEDKSL